VEPVAVAGATLSSLILGRGRGSPVAMLHGLVTGNMASWYFGFGLPLSRTREVLLYDQRGHGDSSLGEAASAHFDLDSQVRDLEAVLAHHGLAQAPIDLVGHSMGALLALHFALRQPQRLRRLVLVDAPMPARDYVGPSLLGIPSYAAASEHAAAQPRTPGGGRRRERLHRRLSALFLDSTLIRDVLAMAGESEAALAALQRPVLLVYGRHSPCAAAARHLQAVLPQARLEWLDCGHYVLEEAPAALRERLEDFLSPVDDPSASTPAARG
jgi:pimeloyl-ACP methyl ester carboxylesterase